MRASSLVLSVSIVLSSSGCPSGPTQGEVVDRFAAPLAARLADLKAAVASVPAGSVTAPSAAVKLEPAPEYRRKDGVFTLDILAARHVDDPTFEFFREPAEFDLNASEVLRIALKEAAPNGLSADDRARSAWELYPQRFEKALAIRYVAVVRTVECQKAVATSDTEFTGGRVRLEVLLIDTQDKAVKASFPVDARAKPSVEFMYQEGKGDRRERLAAFANSSVWEDARVKIADGLRATAGANVAFD